MSVAAEPLPAGETNTVESIALMSPVKQRRGL